CTSGTAAANYYPAVIEAAMDMVPMILLTADRPPELRDTGANQTINQVNLFGKYTRFHFNFPCPDEQIQPQFILTTIDQAVHRATCTPMGPVHINCMFREPLAPTQTKKNYKNYLANINNWMSNNSPFTSYAKSVNIPDENKITQIAATINKAEDGVLLVGHLKTDAEKDAVCHLSQNLNWPLFTDIQSDLRLSSQAANLISYFDHILLSNKINNLKNKIILHLGGTITSKRFNLYLQQNVFQHYIHVENHPYRHDPYHRITDRIESDITLFCRQLINHLTENPSKPNSYLAHLQKYNKITGDCLSSLIDDNPNVTEPAVARLVSKYIRPDSCLFLGNSMPIRDMDMYSMTSDNMVKTIANRGVSGIDGNIATFIGFANGVNRRGTLLIGDLTFLHDLNSLAMLKDVSQPLTLVVINNNGGGIFSFLPVAECQQIFEPYFATPHQLTFEKIAAAFKLKYYKPSTKEDFIRDYKKTQKNNLSSIIEVITDREENYKVHLILQEKIKSALDNF
ncbi:MAG: 2-succinyl-5-enolpyruvyl-6-hydroxy-3-cyclohexene-1-carboxylic-acid synthase, partial [Candidatus Zixiibacteriota bacterium]